MRKKGLRATLSRQFVEGGAQVLFGAKRSRSDVCAGEGQVEGEDGVLGVDGEHEMADARRRFLGDVGM